MRKIDLHAYSGTREFIESQGEYIHELARYWKREWVAKEEHEVIDDFEAAGVEAILVAFDIESVTGYPPCSNDFIARLRDDYPDRVIQGWAAVDPWKDSALDDAERAIRDLGLLGFHFHPIMGRYSVDDRSLYPLWELVDELRVPVMIDVGTTGMGAGMPGGSGTRIDFAHPMAVDHLAADFPHMTIIAAHPGWPWVDEMTAVVLHKGNVYWELSGWAPKYFPDQLKRDIRSRLRHKILWGSDYPSMPYERLFREWGDLGYTDDVLEGVFHRNAERVLGL